MSRVGSTGNPLLEGTDLSTVIQDNPGPESSGLNLYLMIFFIFYYLYITDTFDILLCNSYRYLNLFFINKCVFNLVNKMVIFKKSSKAKIVHGKNTSFC